MVAGVQTYLNPILDLPYYYLSVEWFQNSPKVVAFIMGLPYGLVMFLCLFISNEISLSLPKPKKLEVFLAAVFGLTGTIVIAEVGTTFNDISGATSSSLNIANVTASMNNNQYRVKLSTSCSATSISTNSTPLFIAPGQRHVSASENYVLYEGGRRGFWSVV